MHDHLPSDEEVRRQLAQIRPRVMEAVRTKRTPRRSTTFRRVRNLAVVGGVGLALTAGGLFVAASTVDRESVVRCYEDANLNSASGDAFSFGTGGTEATAEDHGAHTPIASCAALWAVGDFTPGADPAKADPIYPVPPLTACALNNGMAAVFPNREELPADRLCGTLGLAVWDSDSGV